MIPSGRNAERIITVEKLHRSIEYLTDTLFRGRETGTRGSAEAAFWIVRKFKGAGLMPVNGLWSQSFTAGSRTGHNIIGFMPGKRSSAKEMYTIVTAHYDSHGMIDGKLYPGADSNASGVVAMTSIADMFARMKELGRSYPKNMIFVATDAREKNSLGAEAFMDALDSGIFKDPVSKETITKDKVAAVVVLDILGSSLEPMNKGRKDYLLMLSDGLYRSDLQLANAGKDMGLDIGFNYYGSEKFTEMFLKRIGDQKVFAENDMPVVMFTSGITMKTNKVTDDADSLNYEMFRKRILLIFHWFEKML